MALVTVPISTEARSFAEHILERHDLLIVATPAMTDRFHTDCLDRDMTWGELEKSLPVIPSTWWHNLPGNWPIADALSWAISKGFVEAGPVTRGQLLLRASDGIEFRCRSTGSPAYYKNIETHIAYLRSGAT